MTLAATGWVVAAIVMAALWAAERRREHTGAIEAVSVGLVGALAVLYATASRDGMLGRRVAIASMMGSWGARLAIHFVYDRARRGRARSPSFWRSQAWAAGAFALSLPALAASVNPAPDFSRAELAAAALWAVAFAGASTADRQRFHFAMDPANDGRVCDVGLWRLPGHPDRMFEGMTWVAFVVFAFA